jgi:replicative DNA helicase
LFAFLPTAANASYYIDILQEKHTLRDIFRICTQYAARSYEETESVPNLLDEVEGQIYEIAKDRYQDRTPNLKKLLVEAITGIEELYNRRGQISGLATGFTDFDKMTDGLHGAEMIVIAARPSMGKTALAMNIAEHVAVDQKKPIAVFSLEMSTQQLVQRLLCSRAKVNLARVRDGFLNERDFPALQTAASKLAESKIFIDDTSGLSILELRAKARRLKSQHDIQAIFIDYLQLLRSTSRRAQDNRQIEIAEISSGLKALAKELAVPILVLAQLNRNPESRSGDAKGRPRLSDLRESGSIEQDADLVGLLVREEYYADTDEDKKAAEGKATLIIAKQRNGPVGDVPLTFLKEFTRFETRAYERDSDE